MTKLVSHDGRWRRRKKGYRMGSWLNCFQNPPQNPPQNTPRSSDKLFVNNGFMRLEIRELGAFEICKTRRRGKKLGNLLSEV